jgi:hypothetical protein
MHCRPGVAAIIDHLHINTDSSKNAFYRNIYFYKSVRDQLENVGEKRGKKMKDKNIQSAASCQSC